MLDAICHPATIIVGKAEGPQRKGWVGSACWKVQVALNKRHLLPYCRCDWNRLLLLRAIETLPEKQKLKHPEV